MKTMKPYPKDNDDLLWIAEMRVSRLYLYRDQRFRGYSILSFNRWEVTRLEALTDEAYHVFCQDL